MTAPSAPYRATTEMAPSPAFMLGTGAGTPGFWLNGACSGAPCGGVNADCANALVIPIAGRIRAARKARARRLGENPMGRVFKWNRGDFKPHIGDPKLSRSDTRASGSPMPDAID